MYNQNNTVDLQFTTFLILNILFVSISAIQTFLGYRLMLGTTISLVFAFAIAIMFLFLNFRYRELSKRNESTRGLLFIYLLPLIFSFGGNFNAFYMKYMSQELLQNEVLSSQETLDQTYNSSLTALQGSTYFEEAEEIKSIVNQLKINLVLQILDESNPGYGTRAKLIKEKIDNILELELTVPYGTPAQIANSFEKIIDSSLEFKIQPLLQNYNDVKRRIDATYDSISHTIKRMNFDSADLEKYKTTVNEIAEANNLIGELTNEFLSIEDFDYSLIEPLNRQYGKMSHSYRSAFVYRVNNTATILITFMSLGIDLLIPLFVRFTTTASNNYTSNLRISHRFRSDKVRARN
ncbi:MAG: hypothetical protein ED557_00165 [Balneola sp.]|nr:MAG: hypothetical protein ED557_00165 [Balneola sp.]